MVFVVFVVFEAVVAVVFEAVVAWFFVSCVSLVPFAFKGRLEQVEQRHGAVGASRALPERLEQVAQERLEEVEQRRGALGASRVLKERLEEVDHAAARGALST